MAKKTAKKTKKTTGAKVKKTTKKSSPIKKTAGKKVSPKKKTSAAKSSTNKITKRKQVTKKTATKKTPVKKSTTRIVQKTIKKKAPASKIKQQKVSAKSVKEIATEDEFSAAERRAKAIKKIKGYGKKDLEHFRDVILEKRDEIIEQLQNLKEQMLDPTTGEYINENSPYSLHMAEQGTDAMEREKTFLYAQRENKFLGYLEDALKRIENGTYGICVECIEEPQNLCETCPLIPKERLLAVPHSQHCLPIKQRQERK